MRRISTIILILVFAGFGAAAFATHTGANLAAENSAGENLSVPAKALYTRNCARCHGADGKSQGELGQTLDATDLTTHKPSVKRNIQVISNGLGAMPAFGRKLKRAEITALANYVRTL